MHITATLKPRGHIAERWTSRNQIGGTVSGVGFTKQRDGSFVADNLSAEQHEALRHNSAVEIAVSAISVIIALPEPDPEPATADPSPEPPAQPRPAPVNPPRRHRTGR